MVGRLISLPAVPMVQNKSLVLAKKLVGWPNPGVDPIITTSDFNLNAPPPEGGLILKTNYVSFDPFQRGHMQVGGYEINQPSTTTQYLQSFLLLIRASRLVTSLSLIQSYPSIKSSVKRERILNKPRPGRMLVSVC
jgi:hypothetical protein